MKICGIDVFEFDVRQEYPTQGPWHPVGCRIYTDAGVTGDGEIALSYGVAGRAAAGILRDYAPLLIGQDPMKPESVWDHLYRSAFWAQGGGPVTVGGISAIDVGLWDIKAKVYGVPAHQLLGGKRRDHLRAYASQLQFGWGDHLVPQASSQDYFDTTRRAMDEGFDAVKVDFLSYDEAGNRLSPALQNGLLPGWAVRMVRDRFAAVREALGDAGEIIMECHAYTDGQSIRQLIPIAEEFRALAIEEPTDPDLSSYRSVKSRTTTPIAGGERIYTRRQFRPFFEAGAIDIAQPDIGTCGGLTEAKKIADLADSFDIGFQTHICSTPLLNSAAVQLESTVRNFTIHEHHICFRYGHNIELCDTDRQPVQGHFEVPDEPGIGNQFSRSAIDRAEVHSFGETATAG